MKRIGAILVCIAMLCTSVLIPVYAENTQSAAVKVESVVFSDSTGQSIVKLPTDGAVEVTANLRNLSNSTSVDVIMLVCVYENEVLMRQHATANQQIAPGEVVELRAQITDIPSEGEISVFFWSGDSQIIPLARPAVFPSNNVKIWKLMVGGVQVDVHGNEAKIETVPNVIPQMDFYMENSAVKVECLSQAATVPGEALYRFTAPDGTTADFTICYVLKPEYEIYATGIRVNGLDLISFDKNRLEYDAQVEYGTENATVEVIAQPNVTVSYSPSQTINPAHVDTVTATLTSSDGKVSKEYKVHVRAITIESSDARKAYMNGNHDYGDNKIVLSEILIGDAQKYTYTSNGKECTGLLGGNVYTTRLEGDVMTRFGATGENLIGMSHILVSHRDSHKQASKDYKGSYLQSGNAGAYMYNSKNDHFNFTAGVSGTMYIYTVGAGGARFEKWSQKKLDNTLPIGYDKWADVPANTVLTGNQGDMMVQNEYLFAQPINCKEYTNVYIQSFKAGEKISVPTIGQNSYESVKVLIKWDEAGPQKSNNVNLASLGYRINSGSEVNALEIKDSQVVTVPNNTDTVELSFMTEDNKAQGAVQNPAGAVTIGDKPVTLTVTVTAEDGSTKNYTVTFEKAAEAAKPNATGIKVNGLSLTSFHKERLEYDAQVEYGTDSVTVEVTADPGVEVNYRPSQTINPAEIDTVIATLKSGGATKEYKIHVRAVTIESSDARKAYMGKVINDDVNVIKLSQIPIGDRLEENYTSNNQEVTASLGAPLFTTQVVGNEMSRAGAMGEELIGMSHILVNHNDTHKQAQKKFSTYKNSGNAGFFMYKNRAVFFTMQAAVSGTVYVYTAGAAGSMYDSWTKKELAVGSPPSGYDSWAEVPDGIILEGSQSDVLVRNQYFTSGAMTATPYTHVYSRKFNAGDVVSIPTIGQDSYNVVKVLIDWDPLGGDPGLFRLRNSEKEVEAEVVEISVSDGNEAIFTDAVTVTDFDSKSNNECLDYSINDNKEGTSVCIAEVPNPVLERKEVSTEAVAVESGMQVDYAIGNMYADIIGKEAFEDIYLVVTKAGYNQKMLLEEIRKTRRIPDWVYAIENVLPDPTGNYAVRTAFPLGMESARYWVSDTDGHQIEFVYTNPQNTLQVLTEIVRFAQQKDIVALKGALDKMSCLDEVNYALYSELSDAGKTEVSRTLIGLDAWPEGEVTLENMRDVVVMINRAVVVPGFNEGIIEEADMYLTYLSEENGKAGQDYNNRIMAEGRKRVTTDLCHQDFSSIKELQDVFVRQVILKMVAYPKNGRVDILEALTGYPEVLMINMTSFEKLADAYQYQVLKKVKEAKPKDLEDLKNIFGQAVSAYMNNGGTVSRPGGGGGGSNSGASHSGGGFAVDESSGNDENNTINQPEQQKIKVESFSDYMEAEWAEDSMQMMLERGIWNGYEDNTLRPNEFVLREEAYKMFVCAFSKVDNTAVTTFMDIKKGDWFYPYIASAQVMELTSGVGNGLFGTGQKMTRQDLAVMFYRYMKNQYNLSYNRNVDYTDALQIADYAREAVEKLASFGIISGYDDGTFRPEANATRAEMAEMMSRMLDILS